MLRIFPFLFLAAGCQQGSSPYSGPGFSGSGAVSLAGQGDPWVARRICEADCRKHKRCDPSRNGSVDCGAQCARKQPVAPSPYDVVYVDALVRCVDSACAEPDFMACSIAVERTMPMNESTEACVNVVAPSPLRDPAAERAVLEACHERYSGLTRPADAFYANCLRQRGPGAFGPKCEPPSYE